MRHAAIIPLIGGLPLGTSQAFGSRPEYLLTYNGFQNNDQHLVKYYGGDVPYINLDEGGIGGLKHVEVVSSTCPCAGLSSLSTKSKSDSPTNEWMVKSSRFVLESVKPDVLFGENAPRLASKTGEPVVAKLRQVAKENGYTFALYRTKSILHGLSQVRDRSFFFFFKGDRIPILPFFQREHIRIEDHIRSVKLRPDDPMNVLTNKKTPSKDEPFYRLVLEKMLGGISHAEFQKRIEITTNPMNWMEEHGGTYPEAAAWFRANGFNEKVAARCDRIQRKLDAGFGIMKKITEIPKDYIGAFVAQRPSCLTHPDEDRYLTIRECLSIMGMPEDFQLQGGVRNLNHVCQNVPVTTAKDIATGVKLFLEGKLPTEKAEFALINNVSKKVQLQRDCGSLEQFFTETN